MSRGELGLAVRRWAPVVGALVGLVAWSVRLESKVDAAAPASSVVQMQGQLNTIENKLNDISARQSQFFCSNKPAYCR